MELHELVGLHYLTGVDRVLEPIAKWYNEDDYGDCQVLNFVLDGKTYSVIEDPSDGYRSAMREIKESDCPVTNTFQPVQVMCIMRMEDYRGTHDILDCYDVQTGKPVLAVGTKDTNDYYPCFIAEFSPENMSINA